MIQETIIIKNTLSYKTKNCGLYLEFRLQHIHAIKLSQENFAYALIENKRFIIKNIFDKRSFVIEITKLIDSQLFN